MLRNPFKCWIENAKAWGNIGLIVKDAVVDGDLCACVASVANF